MTVESSRPDIVSVQMLRGVAALMVVFVHLDVHLRRLQLGWIDSEWLASGVDIFFVISGFMVWVTTVPEPTSDRVTDRVSFWNLLDRTGLELSIFGKQPLWLRAWSNHRSTSARMARIEG